MSDSIKTIYFDGIEKASVNEIPEINRLLQQANEVVNFAEFLLTNLIMAHARTVNQLLEEQKR
jgi:hypothetical protein